MRYHSFIKAVFLFTAIFALSTPVMAQYSGGDGSAANPWRIATPADLIAVGQNTTHYSHNFIMTADIDMTGSGSFATAVIAWDTDNGDNGFQGAPFTGVFDGDGWVIENLTIDDGGAGNDHLGLFGKTGSGAEIRSLRLESGSVTGDRFVGGLVGYNDGDITSCSATGAVSGDYGVGGLAGWNYTNGTLMRCAAAAAVTGDRYVGGLAGRNSLNGTITRCGAIGAVTGGVNSDNLGGLVGSNGTATLTSCYAFGAVTGGDYGVGGLAGYNDGTVTSCYATGAVTGTVNSFNLGGLVGWNYGTLTDCYATGTVTGENDAGGLVGENDGGTLTDCYAIGVVYVGVNSNNDDVGVVGIDGLVGFYESGTITSCYFLDRVGPDYAPGTPLTDAAMRLQASFVGFNFTNAWIIGNDQSYPYPMLRSFSDDCNINPVTENCSDGIDNDCDGLIDGADIDCSSFPPLDDDGDGIVYDECITNPEAEACSDGTGDGDDSPAGAIPLCGPGASAYGLAAMLMLGFCKTGMRRRWR